MNNTEWKNERYLLKQAAKDRFDELKEKGFCGVHIYRGHGDYVVRYLVIKY